MSLTHDERTEVLRSMIKDKVRTLDKLRSSLKAEQNQRKREQLQKRITRTLHFIEAFRLAYAVLTNPVKPFSDEDIAELKRMSAGQ